MRAHIAQSVERRLGKAKVSGSNPDVGSTSFRIRASGLERLGLQSMPWHARFQLVHLILFLFVGLGAALGAGVGVLLGDWQRGLSVGSLVGAGIGLALGLVIARRVSTELSKPLVPPPEGWRRWDEDE